MIDQHDITYRRNKVSDEEFAELLGINLDTLDLLENEGEFFVSIPGNKLIEINYELQIAEMRLEDEVMDNIHLRQLIADTREVLRNFLEKGWSKEALVALKDKLRREL